MSHKGPENSNQPTFSSGAPHFFKIILEKTLQEKKLRIPQKLVRKCGETLSDSVFVKLPSGSRWKIKLEKNDGKVWLEKGWPQFAKHYGIERGHMVVFRYEGNSEFFAVIFDATTVEIDYLSIPIHFDESDIDEEPQVKRELNSAEILEKFSPCSKTGERSSVQCSRPPKRVKTSPIGKTQSRVSCHDEKVIENSISNRKRQSSNSKMKGKHDFPAESDIANCKKRLGGSEKVAALQKASDFTSNRPFFKVLIQPSYIYGNNRLNFPPKFARKYLKNKSKNAILKVSNGRKTWLVKYTLEKYSGVESARFLCGWMAFARDNKLEVGDVCVFVLLKGIQVSFEVIIFRGIESSKALFSSANEGGSNHVEPEQNLSNETESAGAINDNKFPVKQANGCMSTARKTSLIPNVIGRRRPLTSTEKAKILERARFESENPFFIVVIQPSYTSTNKWHMRVPEDFTERYIKNEGDVVLLLPSGRLWSAQLRKSHLRNGKFAVNICSGWNIFAEDNNLEVGDVCIFELLKGTGISFEVSIVQGAATADDAYCQRSHAGASKPNGDIRVKTEID